MIIILTTQKKIKSENNFLRKLFKQDLWSKILNFYSKNLICQILHAFICRNFTCIYLPNYYCITSEYNPNCLTINLLLNKCMRMSIIEEEKERQNFSDCMLVFFFSCGVWRRNCLGKKKRVRQKKINGIELSYMIDKGRVREREAKWMNERVRWHDMSSMWREGNYLSFKKGKKMLSFQKFNCFQKKWKKNVKNVKKLFNLIKTHWTRTLNEVKMYERRGRISHLCNYSSI